jgi:hypothetical protein
MMRLQRDEQLMMLLGLQVGVTHIGGI